MSTYKYNKKTNTRYKQNKEFQKVETGNPRLNRGHIKTVRRGVRGEKS